MRNLYRGAWVWWALGAVLGAPTAWGDTLRVATWNIDADTGGALGAKGGVDGGPGLITVLQAMGAEHLNGNAQPLDVLALEELNGVGGNSANASNATLQFIVGQLNSIYGAGTYAYDLVTDPTDAPGTSGNGPSGLIYNTNTVQDLGALAIGSVGSSGAARAPMLYHLAPLADPTADFYMYVEHAKSGTGTTNENRREVEASEVRSSAASLGTDAHIIYAGDLNTTSSSAQNYQTMVGAGTGQGFDVANPANNWTASAGFKNILTESSTNLEFRDDYQLVSGPMLNATSGLQLIPGSYTAFGNNGTTAFHASTNLGTNTALADLANQSSVLSGLSTATDHLPIVADYTVVTTVPEPTTAALALLAGLFLLGAGRRRLANRNSTT